MELVAVFAGYPILLSDRPAWKYQAKVNGRNVYFGEARFPHYRDTLGHYSEQDSEDPSHRKAWYRRHPDSSIEGSKNWFTAQILFPEDDLAPESPVRILGRYNQAIPERPLGPRYLQANSVLNSRTIVPPYWESYNTMEPQDNYLVDIYNNLSV